MKLKTLFLSLILASSLLLSFNSWSTFGTGRCDPDFDLMCNPNDWKIKNWFPTIEEAINQYKLEDFTMAFDSFWILSQVNNAEAQFRLALMHLEGKGTRKNPNKALKWFTKAAKLGHKQAKEFLEKKAQQSAN